MALESPRVIDAAAVLCESYCNNPCSELLGDVHFECGACTGDYACHPGAEYWPPTLLKAVVDVAGHQVYTSGAAGDGAAHAAGRQIPNDRMGGGDNQIGTCDDETEAAVSNAFDYLAALPEDLFWLALGTIRPPSCSSPEDVSKFSTRGYAVVRRLVSNATLARAVASVPSRVDKASEGPARFKSEYFDRDVLAEQNAPLLANLEGTLHTWREAGLLPSSVRAAVHGAHSRSLVVGYKYVRTDPSARGSCMAPCYGRWHVDPSPGCPRLPRAWMMLQRHTDHAREHGNIAVVGTHMIRRLHSLAMELELNATAAAAAAAGRDFDAGRAATAPAVAPPVAQQPWARTLEAVARLATTSGSLREQGGGLPRRELALERLSCTVVLDPGDLLVFEGPVYHRTQDYASARVVLLATMG